MSDYHSQSKWGWDIQARKRGRDIRLCLVWFAAAAFFLIIKKKMNASEIMIKLSNRKWYWTHTNNCSSSFLYNYSMFTSIKCLKTNNWLVYSNQCQTLLHVCPVKAGKVSARQRSKIYRQIWREWQNKKKQEELWAQWPFHLLFWCIWCRSPRWPSDDESCYRSPLLYCITELFIVVTAGCQVGV